MRVLRPILALYQKSGLRELVRGLLPERLRSMEALLPKLGKRSEVAAVTSAQGEKRRRVALVLGCVQREFLSEVNAATARLVYDFFHEGAA